jgi:hypothetical protein
LGVLVRKPGAQDVTWQGTVRQGQVRGYAWIGFDGVHPGDLLELDLGCGIALLAVQAGGEHSAGGDGRAEDGKEGCVHDSILC